MKNNFKFVQIFLLMYGVFSAGTDEVKTVMEGESVTLNPDLTQIQGIIQMKWRFRDSHSLIAQIEENDISYPSLHEMFKDRLKLDQTGSLTITNMRTKHSGLYKLEINHNRGTSYLNFSVTVYESPAVIDAFKGETKSVSETEGNSVTLQTDTETHGDELIVWRFGDDEKLIAKHDQEAKSPPLYDPDERFRDRLKLNNRTGSLTITNTRITDSGVYKVKISSSKQTLHKRFTVTVSIPVPGLSPGAVAGIVVVLLLVFSAAAAAVFIYYHHKDSELLKRMRHQVYKSVLKGRPVTLYYDTEIQKDDKIQWKFEEKLIAEMTGENRWNPQWSDEFRDQMKLDPWTGSLIIHQTRPEHSGLYKLEINTSDHSTFRHFRIIVFDEEKSVPVMEGADVTLRVNPEIQTGDKIFWMFGHDNRPVAKNTKEKCEEESEYSDVRFKDKVDLNRQTGDLTIKIIETDHTGEYKLKIIRNGKASFKLFRVSVTGQVKTSVEKGRPVALNFYTEIQKDDKIQWKFEEKLIVEMTGENRKNPQWSDEFRGQIKLNPWTGSLFIHRSRPEHAGLYKLEIKTSDYSTFRLFRIIVCDEVKSVPVMEGADVTLCVDPKIQTGDKIFWMFGHDDCPVAKNTEEKCEEESEYSDVRFKDKVDLNHQTGDLTIKTIRTDHSGEYKVKIIRNGKSSFKIFTVTVSAAGQVYKSVLKGYSVTLDYDTDIQKDDKIQWKFEEKLIAEMTGENHENPQWSDDEFRDQMKLDPRTGSLFIYRSRPEHSGLYKLEINTSYYSTFRLFSLIVCDEVKSVSVMKGADVTLRVNPEIQTGDKIFWMFGDDNSPIAKNTEEKCEEESEYSDDRFKDKVDLNPQTGDLTIKTIRTDHTGEYKLKIIRNGKSSFKIFNVTVSEQVNKSVLKGRPVTLNYYTDILKDDKIQWKFEEKLIAEMTGENRKNPQWSAKFRDQMKLDPQTGSLIIQQTTPEHSGLYKLEIKTSYYSTFRFFRNIVFDEQKSVPVMKGADVTLRANTEIQTGDKIFWMFGDKNRLVDKNTKEKCEEESEYSDVRFKDKVDLNRQTGDLTIKKTETVHTGEYKLKIIRNGKSSFKIFRVTVSGQVNKSVLKGRPVTLNYDTDILKDDKIQWKFEEKLIAEMTGENREKPQWSDDEFRDQMKLDPQTGSLFIERTKPEHSGLYKLEINTSYYSTFRLFSLIVFEEKRKPLMKEKREDESVTVEMPLLKEDLDGVNEQESLL